MNRRTIAIRQFVALLFAAFAALFVIVHGCGCTPQQVSDAKDAAKAAASVADKACDVVEAFTDDGTVTKVCATVDELAAIAKMLQAERPDGGTHARPAKCVVLPTTTFCATNAETARGIDLILAQRRAWFALDAGARK